MQPTASDPGSSILQPAQSLTPAKGSNDSSFQVQRSNTLQPTITQNQALALTQLQGEGLGPQSLPPATSNNWLYVTISAAIVAVAAAGYLWRSSKITKPIPSSSSKSPKKVGKTRD